MHAMHARGKRVSLATRITIHHTLSTSLSLAAYASLAVVHVDTHTCPSRLAVTREQREQATREQEVREGITCNS